MIINGNLILRDSLIESLGNIEEVNGYVDLMGCNNLKDLGKLKIIRNNVTLNSPKLKSLRNLKSIDGKLGFLDCNNLETLGNLEIVTSHLGIFRCEKLKSLGNLKIVRGLIKINNSSITKEYVQREKPWLYDKCKWLN